MGKIEYRYLTEEELEEEYYRRISLPAFLNRKFPGYASFKFLNEDVSHYNDNGEVGLKVVATDGRLEEFYFYNQDMMPEQVYKEETQEERNERLAGEYLKEHLETILQRIREAVPDEERMIRVEAPPFPDNEVKDIIIDFVIGQTKNLIMFSGNTIIIKGVGEC